MTTGLVPLGPYIDQAAELFAARYLRARLDNPLLPSAWGEAARISGLLMAALDRGPSVALVESGRLIGYFASAEIRLPDWSLAISREWANAALPDVARNSYGRLYAAVSDQWLRDGFVRHDICLLETDDDAPARDALAWLGFGRVVMDGLRDLTDPDSIGAPAGLAIRRAIPGDAPALEAQRRDLATHLNTAPVFQMHTEWSQKPLDSLSGADSATFVAELDGTVVAFVEIGPCSRDASWVIRDPGTASITGAYTVPEARKEGVATALLGRAVGWARDRGATRCAVDWETSNLEGNRFWLRHFRPVVGGFTRILDVPPAGKARTSSRHSRRTPLVSPARGGQA